MAVFYSPGRFHFKKEPIATITQTPVQNTWYTVLDTTSYVRILYIAVKQDNTDNVAKALEIRVTIDGNAISGAGTPGDNTWNYINLTPTVDTLSYTAAIFNSSYYVEMRGHSVKVELRMTDAPGTAETLDGRVQYEVLSPGEV